MAVYTQELNTNYNFPHIDIYNRLTDGVLMVYEARTQDGYVMYNPNSNDVEWNEELQEDVPCTYYYRIAGFPKTYNFNNFPYIAVAESEVDENYIFGGGNNNDHEIM